jgi:uncharacterized protein (TIGR00251 family)
MSTIAVVVTPKSSKNEIAGWRGSELSVKVTAAPEAGKANAAVCATLARALEVPKSRVRVIRGDTARHKILEIADLSESEVHALLGRPGEQLF